MVFANIWQRLGAFLLDYLIIAVYLVLLVIISVGLGFGPLRSEFRALFADPNSSELSAFLLLVLPVILYFALFEHSSWQATWFIRSFRAKRPQNRGRGVATSQSCHDCTSCA